MSKVTMPFGKHKGKDLENVPDDYLLWVLENADNLRGDLKTYLEENEDSIRKNAAEIQAQKSKNRR